MATPRRPVIAGNWKMFKTNADATDFVSALAQGLPSTGRDNLPEIVICGSFTLLQTLVAAVKRHDIPVTIAAQTMESRDDGAYTGEVSPLMLKDIDVTTVVLGHSERRQYYNETDLTVGEKTQAALSHGITPIVCVGELLEQREAGQTDGIIATQVQAALQGLSAIQVQKLMIAYEPVWAIGTGKVCEADEADRVCGLIREEVAKLVGPETAEQVRILYGGSMKPENGEGLLGQLHIDGGLIGGASLKPDSFLTLIGQASGRQLVS